MFGQACAAKAFSVAAMDWVRMSIFVYRDSYLRVGRGAYECLIPNRLATPYPLGAVLSIRFTYHLKSFAESIVARIPTAGRSYWGGRGIRRP